MSVTGQMMDELGAEAEKYRSALERLVNAAEALVSSEPDMPSHEATETEYDDAIDNAKRALGQFGVPRCQR